MSVAATLPVPSVAPAAPSASAVPAALPASSGSPGQPELTGVAAWAVDLMERLGPVGAGVAIALENLFPPLPSELILPLAGFTASRGEFSLLAAIVATTIGSVVGALVLYGIGARVGRDRVHALCVRLPLVEEADLVRTEEWFARHGRTAVLLGRMVPVFRSLVSLPAGVERMPLVTFTLLTLAGSAIWNSIFVLVGYELGEQWHRVEPVVGLVQAGLGLLVGGVVLRWVVRRVRRQRRERAAAQDVA
ncbi:DedA family protein [Nocardioides sp. TRM66260-LWL]|uniref:DedA family protein n=1 Tax=Nocardioides sp. TRM66260-LWL TaxID=2874478 RepID=UPI001CC3979B|nr:DedA family protein [Nocardioides sp. TRM66260-LWL]MBZ5735690.1 DedA family protein [Nocardioides sp. TRM66260-LWL]